MQFQVDSFEQSLQHKKPMPSSLSTLKNQIFTTTYSSQTIAVKMAITPKGVDELRQEAAILKDLSHPNIVSLYTYSTNRNAIGLEYLDDHDLYNVLYNNANNLSKDQLKYVLHCVASGLAYLHGQNIIFSDLKPENIFMGGWSRGGNGQVKIGDFGMALKLTRDETKRRLPHCFGSSAYASPEMITNYEVSKAGDVYAFACVAYEAMKQMQVFTGTFSEERAFLTKKGSMSDEEKERVHKRYILKAVAAGFRSPWVYGEEGPLGLTYTFNAKYPEIRLDQETQDLIAACWTQDPASRLSIQQVLAHGFFSPSSAQVMTPLETDNVTVSTTLSSPQYKA